MEPMEEVPLTGLGKSELEISAWLTDRSRELIPETRGNVLQGTILRHYPGQQRGVPASGTRQRPEMGQAEQLTA